jgi:hypothetical protein
LSTIKGVDKAKRRFKEMAAKHPEVGLKAMRWATTKIMKKAMSNTTASGPRYLNRVSGTLNSSIRKSSGVAGGGVTIGTVGIPANVGYGKDWELGFSRRVGKGRKRMKRFMARPWLSDAYMYHRRDIRQRFKLITKDLLKVTK